MVSRAEAPGAVRESRRSTGSCGPPGVRLELAAPEARVPDVDEDQLLARLRPSPGERHMSFATLHRNLKDLLARRLDAA